MKIFVKTEIRDFSLECESTETIAHLKAKVHDIEGIPPHEQMLVFDGKQLDDNFSENMTLADVGIQEESMFQLINPKSSFGTVENNNTHHVGGGGFKTRMEYPLWTLIESFQQEEFMMEGAGVIERPRTPENGYIYHGDEFKSGWREVHGKELLHLLLKLCRDGTISEGNITPEAWHRIQNGLENSTKCSFKIDFLEERLRDYKQLYSLLAETSSPVFDWDRENKTVCVNSDLWREYHPKLLLCGPYIPYFDTLEEICLLLNTRRFSEQHVSETSTNINNEKPIYQDIPRLP